jgi:hypothetical protein
LTADHKTSGGGGGSNSNGQATDCYGSCVTYVTQSSQGANGGHAEDNSNVKLEGPIANTDSSGGSSTGGNGGHVRDSSAPSLRPVYVWILTGLLVTEQC